MSVPKSQEHILNALLEKIFFSEKELNILKQKINQVSLREMSPKELRNHIFNTRIQIMEELLEFFPFYVKESVNSNVNSKSERDRSLVEQIKEREELLEIVAKRLMTIYENLKEKKSPENLDNIKEISEVSQLIKKDHFESQNQSQSSKEMKKKLVVDITNILNLDKDEDEKLKIENILKVYNAVVELGYEPYMIADASMRHHLNSYDHYDALEEKGILNQSPAGTKADEWILEVARRENCKFLANDLFRDYRDEFGKDWVFNNRLTSYFYNGKFIIRESKNNNEYKTVN